MEEPERLELTPEDRLDWLDNQKADHLVGLVFAAVVLVLLVAVGFAVWCAS